MRLKIGGDKMMMQAVERKQIQFSITKKIGFYLKLGLRAMLIAVFIILLVLFGIMGICFFDSLYNSSKGISKNPLIGTYVVVTESMIPTINVNDAVIIGRVDESNVNIGDIVTFSSTDEYYNGLTITHRVVGKQLSSEGKYVYRTKGDNNSLEDTALVNIENIYGKVLFKIPKVGYLKNFISSPSGFVLSIIIPVLLIILYEIYRIRKFIKMQADEVEII